VLDAAGQVVPYSNTKALGKLLYTQYLYPVEIAAVILLVAMVAAIALTLRQRKDSKAINPSNAGSCACSRDRLASGQGGCQPESLAEVASEACQWRGEKSMTLTLGHFLSLGAMLFALAVIGIF
jgi:NADH-quinone oxidoreductase subunit J